MPEPNAFDALIEKFISERLRPDELPVFFSFLEKEESRLRYAERIDLDFLAEAWLGWSSENQSARLYDRILQTGNIPISKAYNTHHRTVPYTHFLNTNWLRYAAAVLIIIGGYSVYQYISWQPPKHVKVAHDRPLPVVRDIPPGGNKAILILGDKSVVSLDSLATGSTLVQGSMRIVKSAKGEIHYVPSTKIRTNDDVAFNNTVKTPRGGQYQLTLPDGTQVWLNAESSITYPTSFNGAQRIVSMSGEAYFDVAKNREKPFIVNINDNNSVEALGTHFNINAYTDETNIKTTLLEGKVKVTAESTSVTLLPGQQLAGSQVNETVDLVQVLAWKNGVFTFENKTLQQILREIARWYDLTIIYEKNIPETRLRGEMGMNLNLSQVIKGLEAMEVKCRLEPERKLVISP